MADILHNLIIKAPKEKVFKAITEQEGLAGWWTADVKAEPKVDSIAEFNFGDNYHNEMRITYLKPNKKVEWECIQGDEEWVGTTFTFELEDRDDHVVLRFGHKDWRKATDFFASCNYNWGRYMASLKDFCETGVGDPFA